MDVTMRANVANDGQITLFVGGDAFHVPHLGAMTPDEALMMWMRFDAFTRREATRCEHGVPDLGWCEPCCAAQRQARLDNGYTIDGEGPRHV